MNVEKAWCFFEQTGIFKNEFLKLGILSVDLDIQDNFGQTDYVIDLFNEIKNAYNGKQSIFDDIASDDLIIAFFPCGCFEYVTMAHYDINFKDESKKDKAYDKVIEKIKEREECYILLWKLYAICDIRNIRLIIENSSIQTNYLLLFRNFPKPTIVDRNRILRGDCVNKPVAYWFVNCEPSYGYSYQNNKEERTMQYLNRAINNKDKFIASRDYARNFICDCIIGKKQKIS